MNEMTITMMVARPEENAHVWQLAAGTAIGLLVVCGSLLFFVRRFFRNTRELHQAQALASRPDTENASAFMAASMQGVIQKLRDQEKELERLHQAEKERAEQTERLSEEVTRNMPAGLVVVNNAGIVSSANPAAEQALGVRGLGFRRYSEVLGETSDLTRLIGECLAGGKIFRREQVKYAVPGGESRHLGVTISPIRRGEGKITGAICLLTDLTDMATLQQQVQLKENLAALGELSAGIAHEFKNALATISGYAQMIPDVSGEEAKDYARRILEQARNISHVVTEFLKYARPLEISNERVALQPIVERVVSEVADSAPLIRIRCEGRFENVAGDEGLLRQALLNLARNAAEACSEAPNGGRVLLRGEMGRGENVGQQRITVFDNGPGISAATEAKLFRPFFTTKAKGTGLGLAVVQKIVVQHGGRVEAHNRPEGGAAFIVTLPACQQVAEAVESEQNVV
ncbi:MAG TPA: ATP-binding protein [Candidatus Dormibacteraeota bacterium]|nr:ATP-binding protein [Candidatus Dormibacteraeota bacterium]